MRCWCTDEDVASDVGKMWLRRLKKKGKEGVLAMGERDLSGVPKSICITTDRVISSPPELTFKGAPSQLRAKEGLESLNLIWKAES